MQNRIRSFTRWPADPSRRTAIADVDIGFAAAMAKIMGCDLELQRIASVAFRVKLDAKNELLEMQE